MTGIIHLCAATDRKVWRAVYDDRTLGDFDDRYDAIRHVRKMIEIMKEWGINPPISMAPPEARTEIIDMLRNETEEGEPES